MFAKMTNQMKVKSKEQWREFLIFFKSSAMMLYTPQNGQSPPDLRTLPRSRTGHNFVVGAWRAM